MTEDEININRARTIDTDDGYISALLYELADSLELALAQLASVREIVELP